MDNSVLNKLLKEENDLFKQKAKIEEDLAFIKKFKERFFGDQDIIFPSHPSDALPLVSIPKKREYRKREGKTVSDKVWDVLESLGKGTLAEVAEFYKSEYPDISKEKAYLDCKFHLSKLYREGKINGVKLEGKKAFEYSSLKKTQPFTDELVFE